MFMKKNDRDDDLDRSSNDDDDTDDDDDDDGEFDPIKQFEQSQRSTNVLQKNSTTDGHNNNNQKMSKLKFTIKTKEEILKQDEDGASRERISADQEITIEKKKMTMMDKFPLQPPPGFSPHRNRNSFILSTTATTTTALTNAINKTSNDNDDDDDDKKDENKNSLLFKTKMDDENDYEKKPANKTKEEKEEVVVEEEEEEEEWLANATEPWDVKNNNNNRAGGRGGYYSNKEEEYVKELTNAAKKKYGKYAFVEEQESPSAILSDLHVEEPVEFDSVTKTVTTTTTTRRSDNSEKNLKNENSLLFDVDVDVDVELEEDDDDDFLRNKNNNNNKNEVVVVVADKKSIEEEEEKEKRGRSPNEEQVSHARALVQAGITKFDLNDLKGALEDFRSACFLLRDNYHTEDILFAKAKTHFVAVLLVLKCEESRENKTRKNIENCAKYARILATVTYMADESVFGGFSQQFMLSMKLICRCLRFAAAKNFNAKYYKAAKEYLDILLKPYFCPDKETEKALTRMKLKCEEADDGFSESKTVDFSESQMRVNDIINETFEEYF